MSTLKRRIPVTIPLDLQPILENFSKQNKISLSQSIALFLREGVEASEDRYLGVLADDLADKTTSFESHDDFWDDILVEKNV